MKLIIGLGNPGQQYEATRHNVGFRVVRAFHTLHADAFGGWKRDGNADVSIGLVNGDRIALVLPTTFMNASGEAARRFLDFWKLAPQDVVLVSDDLDLPTGMVRVRPAGGAGGHNGLKSVIQHLGTEAFPRVRVGVAGAHRQDVPAEDYVLQRFPADEAEAVESAIERAAGALGMILDEGIDAAMNAHN